MEAENMVHSDSMSPASLGICEKLFRRWELKTSLTEGFGQTFPTDPHNTFGSARSPITEDITRVQIGEAIPPDHAPSRDSKKAGYSVLLFGPIGTNNSKRPIPNPKAQGSDPLASPGGPHQLTATPLTLGNSRVVEGPAPLK
ncbi:hypothetical protein L3Q82_022678 [Scortum barcoo]|uniref:Uncharacterized protein n=1 Tax=Scortum barcoo TaxID=214431 RepID=A0ACB8X035_9TELE|nr:hypothetical protein L3Q82_022678 [Scortum barcoo]